MANAVKFFRQIPQGQIKQSPFFCLWLPKCSQYHDIYGFRGIAFSVSALMRGSTVIVKQISAKLIEDDSRRFLKRRQVVKEVLYSMPLHYPLLSALVLLLLIYKNQEMLMTRGSRLLYRLVRGDDITGRLSLITRRLMGWNS